MKYGLQVRSAKIHKDSCNEVNVLPKQPTAYPLRISADLRAKLEQEASGVGRSLNQEIAARLQHTFEEGRAIPDAIIKVVEDAARETDMTFDDALLRYVVAGMQAEPLHRAATEALRAEKFKTIATTQLLVRFTATLRRATELLAPGRDIDAGERDSLIRDLSMLEREIQRFDRVG